MDPGIVQDSSVSTWRLRPPTQAKYASSVRQTQRNASIAAGCRPPLPWGVVGRGGMAGCSSGGVGLLQDRPGHHGA